MEYVERLLSQTGDVALKMSFNTRHKVKTVPILRQEVSYTNDHYQVSKTLKNTWHAFMALSFDTVMWIVMLDLPMQQVQNAQGGNGTLNMGVDASGI